MNRFWVRDLAFSTATSLGAVAAVAIAGYSGLEGAVQAALMFGIPTAFLLAQLPSSLLYTLFPSGGGLGFMGLAALGALLQFFLVMLALLRYRRRRQGALHEIPPHAR